MFEIRAETEGEMVVLNIVLNPAVVFDKRGGHLLKIGEYSEMWQYYHESISKFNKLGSIGEYMAGTIAFMELPKDQKVVDKVFQVSGYVGELYRDTIAH